MGVYGAWACIGVGDGTSSSTTRMKPSDRPLRTIFCVRPCASSKHAEYARQSVHTMKPAPQQHACTCACTCALVHQPGLAVTCAEISPINTVATIATGTIGVMHLWTMHMSRCVGMSRCVHMTWTILLYVHGRGVGRPRP